MSRVKLDGVLLPDAVEDVPDGGFECFERGVFLRVLRLFQGVVGAPPRRGRPRLGAGTGPGRGTGTASGGGKHWTRSLARRRSRTQTVLALPKMGR